VNVSLLKWVVEEDVWKISLLSLLSPRVEGDEKRVWKKQEIFRFVDQLRGWDVGKEVAGAELKPHVGSHLQLLSTLFGHWLFWARTGFEFKSVKNLEQTPFK